MGVPEHPQRHLSISLAHLSRNRGVFENKWNVAAGFSQRMAKRTLKGCGYIRRDTHAQII